MIFKLNSDSKKANSKSSSLSTLFVKFHASQYLFIKFNLKCKFFVTHTNVLHVTKLK